MDHTENKETFKMTYSARQQKEIETIRQKYDTPQEDKMEQLRSLDRHVTQKATTVSLVVGIIGTLIMGSGMSLIMSDFGTALGSLALPVGIVTGILGIAMLACAYPLYSQTLKKEREKAAPEILRLTDELMK